MKAVHVVAGIVGVSVLFAGAIALRSKLKYVGDEKEINKVVGELKAMGVPTTGSEYFHKIPDSENAWTELRPLVFKQNANGSTQEYFHFSTIGSSLLSITTKADLPLLKKYLKETDQRRAAITVVLQRKLKIQVPHDYDEGFMMLTPELATFKGLAREFCVAALAAAMERNADQVKQNLESAIQLANYGIERGEWISVLSSISIWAQINVTCLRIIEVNPSLYDSIHDLMATRQPIAPVNFKNVFQSTFLEQISTCRYYDIPKMDHHTAPFPISLIVKEPETTGNGIFEDGKVQHGDYVPKSPAMRAFMRARLDAWKPFLTELGASNEKDSYPPFSDFTGIVASRSLAPEYLKQVTGMEVIGESEEEAYASLKKGQQYSQAMNVIWKAMDIHRRTGKYPSSLGEIGERTESFAPEGGLILTSTARGLLLQTKNVHGPESIPNFRISYPISLSRTGTSISSSKKTINDYRIGKIDRNGVDSKAGSPPGP